MTGGAYVESHLRDGTVWRWDLRPDGAGVVSLAADGGRVDKVFPLFAMACGDRGREALVTHEVQQVPKLRRSVYEHMAAWDADGPGVAGLYLYARGKITLPDGSGYRGLCLMVLDFDGVMVAGFPVPGAES